MKSALASGSKEVVFSCHANAKPGAIALRCLAMLPPAFVEYALRNGAARVKAVGCEDECAYRLGMELCDERFASEDWGSFGLRALLGQVEADFYAPVDAGLEQLFAARANADVRQLGGNFVIGIDGCIHFAYRSQEPADRPAAERLERVIRSITPRKEQPPESLPSPEP